MKQLAGIDDSKQGNSKSNPHKGVVHNMCTHCFHVLAQEDVDERSCPKCHRLLTNQADGTPLQCLIFDVRRQIEDMMGNRECAKSHHYAASFRMEGDGDIWDGSILRRWSAAKRYAI